MIVRALTKLRPFLDVSNLFSNHSMNLNILNFKIKNINSIVNLATIHLIETINLWLEKREKVEKSYLKFTTNSFSGMST